MPVSRHISKEHPPPTSPKNVPLPSNSHLLITTPSAIQAWDSTGLHTVFKSSKCGIVAAREAKDGSGVLAVADKHVVVLHDAKRGQEHSWGLNANEDKEVRHLEYTQDTKCLFLSTTLSNDIQRYSTDRARLLSPTQAHQGAPIALAISPTGHLMVSASEDPPCVYLKNLALNSASVLVEPRASDAAVCVAAFHPERCNIFLLGFRDGTLAAYDSTRVSRKRHGTLSNQEIANDGEIARFTSLHRVTAKTVTRKGITSKPASITGVAFLQGYKTRAISVGSNGRCRLVDFADGGIILRTWHAKAPLTSVSVLSVKGDRAADISHPQSTKKASHLAGRPSSTNNIIAVGRADGKVHLYDSVGLLLAQKTVSESNDKVISVEWAGGPSPQPLVGSDGVQDLSDAPTIPVQTTTSKKKSPLPKTNMSVQPKSQARRGTTPHRLGLPPELRRPDGERSARSNRRFTIHPDEMEEGTVRNTPSKQQPKAMPGQAGNYLDLFSPVKPAPANADEMAEKPVTSPTRRRPRISSQTFLKIPEPNTPAPSRPPVQSSVPAATASRATSTASETVKSGQNTTPRHVSTHISPLKKRQISFKPIARPTDRRADNISPDSIQPNNNARLLADLRKMSTTTQKGQKSSVLAPFANKQPSNPERKTHSHPRLHFSHPPRLGWAKQRAWHPGNVLEREATWPTDSLQEQSVDEDEDDIWLTSGSEDKETKSLRQRRLAGLQRPPARQTSRSRVGETGTWSTTANESPASTSPRPPSATTHIAATQHQPQSVDGSSEEKYSTAHTHISPVTGDLVVSSADVRQLFPRSSSLSPKRKSIPHKPRRVEKSTPKRERALQEITGNTLGRQQQQKSPWARVERGRQEQAAGKALASQRDERRIDPDDGVLATASSAQAQATQCFKCADTGVRVSGLEAEVARLKGEMLVMKAAMRRHGVPLPASVRGLR